MSGLRQMSIVYNNCLVEDGVDTKSAKEELLLSGKKLTAKFILLEARSGAAESEGLRLWFLSSNLSSHASYNLLYETFLFFGKKQCVFFFLTSFSVLIYNGNCINHEKKT